MGAGLVGYMTWGNILNSRGLSVIRRAMRGRAAAEVANNELVATTVHRRGVRKGGKFYDIHLRMSDRVVAEGDVPLEYINGLGMELAGLDRAVYEEVLEILETTLSRDGVPMGDEPVLMTDSSNPGGFARVRTSILYAMMRTYMGKLTVLLVGYVMA